MPAINGSSGVAHWVSATEKNATPPNQPTTIEEDEDKRHRAEKEVLTLDIWTNAQRTPPTHPRHTWAKLGWWRQQPRLTVSYRRREKQISFLVLLFCFACVLLRPTVRCRIPALSLICFCCRFLFVCVSDRQLFIHRKRSVCISLQINITK